MAAAKVGEDVAIHQNSAEHLTTPTAGVYLQGMDGAGNELNVTASAFNTDPESYKRRANSELRVVVRHDDTHEVSAVFGGSLKCSPELDDAACT